MTVSDTTDMLAACRHAARRAALDVPQERRTELAMALCNLAAAARSVPPGPLHAEQVADAIIAGVTRGDFR
jgi:ribosomal protein S7